MTTRDLGQTLRQLRKSRGMSQHALADRAGLSRNFVAQIERGESTPTVSTLGRLATALGISSGELLGEGPATAGATAEPPVPLVADRIAAGPPMFVADHVERSELLPRPLLRSLGVDPHHAVLVRLGTDQDSMADTIPPGATVLVDRAPVRDIVPRGIYAVREESPESTAAPSSAWCWTRTPVCSSCSPTTPPTCRAPSACAPACRSPTSSWGGSSGGRLRARSPSAARSLQTQP